MKNTNKNEKIKIVNYHDANSYIKDSPFIRWGYLLNMESFNCFNISNMFNNLYYIKNKFNWNNKKLFISIK